MKGCLRVFLWLGLIGWVTPLISATFFGYLYWFAETEELHRFGVRFFPIASTSLIICIVIAVISWILLRRMNREIREIEERNGEEEEEADEEEEVVEGVEEQEEEEAEQEVVPPQPQVINVNLGGDLGVDVRHSYGYDEQEGYGEQEGYDEEQ